MRVSRFRHTLMLLVIAVSGNISAYAQDGTTKRGFQPGASFAIGDFETINTTNGNLTLNFPLGSLPAGRGNLSAGINLLYNSKLYDSEVAYYRIEEQQCEGETEGPVVCPYYQKNLLRVSEQGGWRYGVSYDLQLTDRRAQYVNVPPQEQPQCVGPNDTQGPGFIEMTYVYKLYVIFPDGSSHEMRPYGFLDANSDSITRCGPTGSRRTVSVTVSGLRGP